MKIWIGFEVHHQLKDFKTFTRVKKKSNVASVEIRTLQLHENVYQIKENTYFYPEIEGSKIYELDEYPPLYPEAKLLSIVKAMAKELKVPLSHPGVINRKHITDGSIASGFQRTILVGEKDLKIIPVDLNNFKLEEIVSSLHLEEDSCQRIEGGFDIRRSGVTLIEVVTHILEIDLVQKDLAKNVVLAIKDFFNSYGIIEKEADTIRQDLNLGNKKGRLQIKGISKLSEIEKAIDLGLIYIKDFENNSTKILNQEYEFLTEGKNEAVKKYYLEIFKDKKINQNFSLVKGYENNSLVTKRLLQNKDRMLPETDLEEIDWNSVILFQKIFFKEHIPLEISGYLQNRQFVNLSKKINEDLKLVKFLETFLARKKFDWSETILLKVSEAYSSGKIDQNYWANLAKEEDLIAIKKIEKIWTLERVKEKYFNFIKGRENSKNLIFEFINLYKEYIGCKSQLIVSIKKDEKNIHY